MLADTRMFCLNLARRPDRKLQAWQQFRREKLDVARIVAPDAMHVTEARGWRNKGARACAAAHRLAWREARRAGAKGVVVFEDDVVLCRGFRERLEGLAIPDDWQMIYLGCTFREVPEPVTAGVVRIRGKTWATHAMLLRTEILPELHRLLAPYSRRHHAPGLPPGVDGVAIDDLLCVFHDRWPVYAAYPFLAWQSPGVSAIDGRLSEAWDREGRQLWCPEVAAALDRLVGREPSSSSGAARPEKKEKRGAVTALPTAGASAGPEERFPEMSAPPTLPAASGRITLAPPAVRAVPAGRPGGTFPPGPARLQELPMFCLNLDRRPDRRLRAWEQFRRHRLNVTRIPAPDAVAIEEKRGWMLKGYRACAAAHKLAFRAARKAGAPAVIIFEDDVVLCPDFRARFDALHLPDDWGIFFFGCVFEPPGPELMENGLLRVAGDTCDNHAYAVRADLWPELGHIYRRLSARRGDWSLDVVASSDRIVSEMQKRRAAYSIWPPMAWQSTGLSNNMNEVNGNSDYKGHQIIFPEAIAHLPGVNRCPVRRALVQVLPVMVPEDGPPGKRTAPRPAHQRSPGYEAEFDAATLMCDCFHGGDGEVHLIGPPLLNLEPWATASGFTGANGEPLNAEIREMDRCSRIKVVASSAGQGLFWSGAGTRFLLQPGLCHCEMFKGKRVVFTLQKDNHLEWVRDWLHWHVANQGANAVLLYDNSSTVCTAAQLLHCAATVTGISAAAVVSWPFLYGPQAEKGQPWDSNFAQHAAMEHARWRFLAQARSVLNCDVDECVLTPRGESVFVLAERSLSGVVAFPGQWCVHCPADGEPVPAFVRHQDHRHVMDHPRCPPKWAAVPSRVPALAQWTTHAVTGVAHDEIPGVSYRHFRGISNSWKYLRPSGETYDPATHLPDAMLAGALEVLNK